MNVDEIYGLAEKDFCLASVPTCFCVRLVFVHGEGRRLSTDAGAFAYEGNSLLFLYVEADMRAPNRSYGSGGPPDRDG